MTNHQPPPGALSSPASARNREPILAVLEESLPPAPHVLEIAAGAGEHAVWAAERFPAANWTPTDPDPRALTSIAAWREAAGLPNLEPPRRLDVLDEASWPHERFDAVVAINMVHISPWAAAEALTAGAARVLRPGGVLILYGPYLEDATPTAPSNLAFDADLKRRNPAWGLRRLEDMRALAAQHRIELERKVPMPANNLSLVFRRA
jgi:SAM-dependent methyltransferase